MKCPECGRRGQDVSGLGPKKAYYCWNHDCDVNTFTNEGAILSRNSDARGAKPPPS
jgi:hypothetical protein